MVVIVQFIQGGGFTSCLHPQKMAPLRATISNIMVYGFFTAYGFLTLQHPHHL